jgi:hypothetical protein
MQHVEHAARCKNIGQLYQSVRTSYIIDKMEQEATNASNKQQGAMQYNK